LLGLFLLEKVESFAILDILYSHSPAGGYNDGLIFSYLLANIEWSHTYHRSACGPQRISLASAFIGICGEPSQFKKTHHFNISGLLSGKLSYRTK
jgi:hypothetical protein